MFKGGQEQSFFPSKTLIYGISRDDSKKFNIRTCEHMILGQLRIGARATTYAALVRRAHTFQEGDDDDDHLIGSLCDNDFYEKIISVTI